jgi:nitrogen fixation protein NifU and related proteins
MKTMGREPPPIDSDCTEEQMSAGNNDWKQLYAKEPEAQEEFVVPEGPLLFYNELVIDHFTNPRNVGEMEDADGYALIGDPSCGDQMQLWIKVAEGKITDIKFKSFGCPGAIATSSMCTVMAAGKTIEAAKQLTDDDIIAALEGIPEQKQHCSLLGVNALQEAIRDFERKQGGEESPAAP